ncbi:ATP-dependent helicase [Niallia endozanthoxylica]|uniref:DNA 3'-5' helicase n=1 Tax=Niallia endozanthoxylica TaxID=2036016 RepID=A0A5J5HZF1_9BACI|nr:ATP-dependent helicase [Niallia endozanthoxylica]KAA9027589.1 ATP-dependent helicase [Niallia endozanthoxylica]
MRTAKQGNQLIDLDNTNRSSYQRIYEEGKKGHLECPVCSEKVRLFLGIDKDPYFQHLHTKSPNCKDQETEVQSTTDIETEINGFRIPANRVITMTKNSGTRFKSAKAIAHLPPFITKDKAMSTIHSPYIKALLKANIYLDDNQAEAVIHSNGALLVLAGAGSGKTRVLTARTAYLLTEQKVQANRIMLVTFTAKAAAEMKTRLLNYPNVSKSQINGLVTGTFHSIFYRILAYHYPEKWNSKRLLNIEWQRRQILKDAGRELDLEEKEFAYDAALQQIGYWKNSLVTPEQVKTETSWDEKVLFLYERYENFKKEKALFDFDDMLIGCYQLFQEEPLLLERYQNRFDYFLIDEFQDVNKVQYELIKLLSDKKKNVCVVGDDDQSIYAFRGSDPQYIRYFERDFPKADVVLLSENYRSSHSIVEAANKIIAQNKQRRPKQMHAQFTNNYAPVLFFPEDEEEEATMIITDIREKIASGADPGDFAILFRTNTASRAVFERLTTSSLPFKIDQDIDSFYERFIIKSMLSFLKLSLNEDDQHAIANILPTLFLKQTVLTDLKAESILNDCTLLECIGRIKTNFSFQEKKLKKAVPIIRSLTAKTPLAAIEKIEKELGFQEFLKKRGNEGNQWDKGSDDIRDLKVAAKNFTSIHEFLEHADHMAAMNKEMKQQSKQRKNAVTLSTIHRAKGLEYKIVYVIGTVDGSIPHDYALDSLRAGDSEPLEEERRLLYVAVTRAQEKLFLSVPQNRRGKKASPSRFLTSIRY